MKRKLTECTHLPFEQTGEFKVYGVSTDGPSILLVQGTSSRKFLISNGFMSERHPSEHPSISLRPSLSPSEMPSAKSISWPSFAPTIFPSTLPSWRPSVAPSQVPTIAHSDGPTTFPSMFPSYDPTIDHSDGPTALPSHVPTSNPSANPTHVPTEVPTPPQPTVLEQPPTVTIPAGFYIAIPPGTEPEQVAWELRQGSSVLESAGYRTYRNPGVHFERAYLESDQDYALVLNVESGTGNGTYSTIPNVIGNPAICCSNTLLSP